jgi:hypothetical protein
MVRRSGARHSSHYVSRANIIVTNAKLQAPAARKHAANARLTLSLIDGYTQHADLGSRAARSMQQLSGTEWHFLCVVFVLDAIPAAFLANVLTKKLIGTNKCFGFCRLTPRLAFRQDTAAGATAARSKK